MFKRKQRGQGMTEYIIIVALIGVAAISVYRLFGETIRHQMAGLAQEVSGQNQTEIATAKTAADNAAAKAAVQKKMDSYDKDNH